jgi:hypothetical protein
MKIGLNPEKKPHSAPHYTVGGSVDKALEFRYSVAIIQSLWA